ncbi:MAG: class I SAM-dependent methyltransferase [Alphaproteobacteria bacterium]|nr:class I SAM-dependent methyltransferase [Alphaproteobacteria bacterium]
MILEKHNLFRPGSRVLHVAPELPIAKRFAELLDDRYLACDVNAARYASTFTIVRPLDLCVDLVKLPSRCFDIIIHSHVLEHLPCDPEGVMREFERILKPGGHHFLSVPISGETTREDLSDDLSGAERSMLFGQADHMRVFGRRDLPAMLDRVWGARERHNIEPLELFAPAELEQAAVPRDAWSGISSHTIFHHIRPEVSAVRIAGNASTEGKSKASRSRPRGRPKLILHIGMPKAGTTSLQRWFVANTDAVRNAGLEYWPEAENHSEAMFMAFADPNRIARGAMWFQQDANLSADPAKRASFDGFLDGLGQRTGIVSAEVLWSFPARDVKALAGHLETRGVDTAVLCFIRPPAAFLATAAQQRLRTSLSIGDFGLGFQDKVLIRYHRLASWIENFGPDNVYVLPLADDIIGQIQGLFAQWGIPFVAAASVPGNLNQSISLLAAKGLMALNQALGKGESSSRRLRTILQDIKGPAFRLPESILKRSSRLFRKEANYLVENFDMERDWLLSDAEGVDDALFFDWSYDEVARLLKAVNDALSSEAEPASPRREK